MYLNIQLTQKKIFKKTWPIFEVCRKNLTIGKYDSAYVLKTIQCTSENWYTVYCPERIGRGGSFYFVPGSKAPLNFAINLPSSAVDIDLLGQIIRKLHEVVRVKSLVIDHTTYSLESLDLVLESLKTANRTLIETFDTQNGTLTLLAARFPLTLDIDLIKVFQNTPKLYDDWLNIKQQEAISYPTPRFYKNKLCVIGRYVLTTNHRTVLPLTPPTPYGINLDDETVMWEVIVYSHKNEGPIGRMPYNEFLKYSRLAEAESFTSGLHYVFITEAQALSWFEYN